jgi:hypothetical protein
MQIPPENFLAVELRGKGFAGSLFEPLVKSPCWRFYDDTKYRHKDGWICDQAEGGESISFKITLPQGNFSVRLGLLRSYAGMGKFKVICTDDTTGKQTIKVVDGLWGKQISVYDEVDIAMVTGNATLVVETFDVIPERGNSTSKVAWTQGVLKTIKGAHVPTGNKVKLLSVISYRA